MLGNEFPIISSNLKSGFGVFGTADPYNALLPNNGALNPLGSVYFIPAPAQSGSNLSGAGYGSGLWVKYVLHLDVDSPAMVAGPAPVCYKDNTQTVVTGDISDGFPVVSKSTSAAGWLLPNTGSVAGVGVGSAVSATILNNGGLGCYVFIGLMGFIPSCSLAAGAAGDRVYMSGDYIVTNIAPDGATTYSDFNFIGTILNVTSNIGNVLATGPIF